MNKTKPNKDTINTIFARLKQQSPKPTTELIYNSNFELLISVILSAQATDISVNKVTPNLFASGNTPEALISLGLDKIQNTIKSIGLYKTKAKNIFKTCHLLVQDYNSEIPNTLKQLELLPGVGRKTANVILNTAFNQPTIAVDTHVYRVAHRLNLSQGKTPFAVEQDLVKKIPKEYLLDAHHWLILHGRYTCKARKPNCPECILQDVCSYNLAQIKNITKT